MEVVRKNSDRPPSVTFEEFKTLVCQELDSYGADGPGTLLVEDPKIPEQLVSLLSRGAFDMGRYDVLSSLAKCNSDKEVAEWFHKLCRELWPDHDAMWARKMEIVTPKPEKEIVGYLLRDRGALCAVAADDCEQGYWWTTRERVEPVSREQIDALAKKVRGHEGDDQRLRIIKVTRKVKTP